MQGDFNVCPHGQCRREQQQQTTGAESAGIVQRLEELIRLCREDGHRPTYQDLLAVRQGGARA